jgi:ubiquinone/menaquinone biosynthesis C-methylase UbiE
MAEIAGPPPWTDVGRHGVFPEGTHDEVARFNFLAALNVHIQTRIFPGNRTAYEKRVLPRFLAEQGHAPQTRHELRPYMEADPYWQLWSSLRRSYMEMRQENGRSMVMRQIDELNAKARALNEGDGNLILNPDVAMPRYLTGVDTHCMPGSYYTEVAVDDVSAAANYDCGIFATTGGLLGRYNDGGGRAMVAWIRDNAPDFRPACILDIGCGLGHNTVPLAKLYPDAQIIALDAAAPMLRYGHARAKSLGIRNICFVQENAEATRYPDGHFDMIVTAQFWHETSRKALPVLLREIHRLLAPGGLHLSLEQPHYRGMPAYDAVIRDWDAHYNNEPFWTTLHDLNMMDEMVAAGFDRADCFETVFIGQMERDFASDGGMDGGKDYGRGGQWYGFGSRKAG